MGLMALRGELFLVLDSAGKVTTFPESAVADVVRILTTPAMVRRSEQPEPGVIRELVVTLQPGEEGHAAASLRAAGFAVVETADNAEDRVRKGR